MAGQSTSKSFTQIVGPDFEFRGGASKSQNIDD